MVGFWGVWFAAASAWGAAVVSMTPGAPATVTLDDGRVAEVQVDREPVLVTDVPLGIWETTCAKPLKPKCFYQTSFRLQRLGLVWTKHPDAAKVGTIVRIKASQSPDPVTPLTFALHFSLDRYLGKTSAAAMPPDRITCDSFEWLPGAPLSAPTSIDVTRWDCEFMFPNPETGLMENRILGGVVNAELRSVDAHTVELDGFQTTSGFAPFLLQGDIVSWVLETGNRKYCQVSFKPDFGKIQSKVVEYFSQLKEDFVPYLWQEDDLDSQKQMENLLKAAPKLEFQ